MDFERKRRHISDTFGKAFIPQRRMRHIRWEESVVQSRARREGNPKPVICHDGFCCCGSIECVAQPVNHTNRMAEMAEAERPVPRVRFVHRDPTIQYW
jgi:hypothetical protein